MPAWAQGVPARGEGRRTRHRGVRPKRKAKIPLISCSISRFISLISLISRSFSSIFRLISSSLSHAHVFFIPAPHGGYYASIAPRWCMIAMAAPVWWSLKLWRSRPTMPYWTGSKQGATTFTAVAFRSSSLVLIWFSLNQFSKKLNGLSEKSTGF
jgi:hypothetical protein